MTFPDNFLWGVSASSYQIEGAAETDGKGLSVCDTFYRTPGKSYEDHNGDVACDHYQRLDGDLDLLKEIGVGACRFSVSWPRVLPEGVGRVNEAGLAFYERMVDGMLARGLQPVLTLFHWDYPCALQRRGGWRNPESPGWFEDYAGLIASRLGDRVRTWLTICEPQVVIQGGLKTGVHAPGMTLPMDELVLCCHHLLLGHGRAVQAIRDKAALDPMIGAAPVGVIKLPIDDSIEAVDAARRAMFSIPENDFWNNTWYADPMIKAEYPEDGLRWWGRHLPRTWEKDLAVIGQPLDFYGANYYTGEVVQADPEGSWTEVDHGPGAALTSCDWKVTEAILYWGPKFFHERYGLPIFVTENGMANNDWVQVDDRVRDPQRIDFMARHLRELRRAMADGVPVLGYLHWSWIDNFEWYAGYSRRFGLIHVDFATQQRTLKDSARWYAEVIRRNGDLP